jgi:hypothetical protein
VLSEIERLARQRLTGGRRHVYEAEIKEQRRTHGHPAHSATLVESGHERVER